MLIVFGNTSIYAQTNIKNENDLLKFWDTTFCNENYNQKEASKYKLEGDKSLVNIAINFKQQIQLYYQNPKDTNQIVQLHKIIQVLDKKQYQFAKSYVQFRLSELLYKNQQPMQAIELVLHSKEELGENSEEINKRFPHLGSFYAYLGRIYVENSEQDLALLFLNKAVHYPFCKPLDEYYCWGNIGLTYFNLNETQKALDASFKALEKIKALGDSVEMVSMFGNIGTIYLKQGDFKNAIKYLEMDYEGSVHFKKWESANAVQIMLAKSYINLHQYASAESALLKADSIAKVCNCLSRGAHKEYYEQLSKLLAHKKDWPAYANSIDSYINYSNMINIGARDNIFNFLGTELKVASKMHETKMQLIESEKQRQLLIRNLIIAISLLVILIVLFFLYNQRNARKTERRIYELNLANSKRQLDAYLENIRNKNQLLDELHQKLADNINEQNLENNANLPREKDIALVAKIEKASLITEESWLEFTALVEQVHQYFFTKLNITFSNLTPAEVRLITLIKLKFSIKESAAMLGISADSVRKARYRLRKKLSLEDENSLENLIQSI